MNETVRVRLRRLLGFGVAVVLAAPLSATAASAATSAAPSENAAVVSDWNATALKTLAEDANKVSVEWPLYLAFMHAAIYDAVVGIKGRYRPYVLHDRGPAGASATAAAAAAAHKVLETYEPYAQFALDTALASSLAGIPDGRAKADGVAFGERVAGKLIALRVNDGRNAAVSFTKPAAPGVWRPTPPAFALMAVPWLGGVTPQLVNSAQQFAPPPPPALTSGRYTRDFAEVKTVGSETSTQRTAGQTATALFFSGNAVTQYNAALRDQAAKRGLGIVQAARMFAAVDMTVSDALITTWRAKLLHGVWRPSTAIQLADTDGNPATAADPAWKPLLANPPYPDYVSGYNAFTASFSRALERLFGGHLRLTLASTAVPGVTRSYDSGRALRADVVNARVWLGIHYRFADVGGRNLGTGLAEWTLSHHFQPVNHHG